MGHGASVNAWIESELDFGRSGEEEVPGVIEVEPALRREPACGQAGDVQQCVPARAYHFGSVPVEEGSGCGADARRMGVAPQANGTAAALVDENPPHSEQADAECANELNIFWRG